MRRQLGLFIGRVPVLLVLLWIRPRLIRDLQRAQVLVDDVWVPWAALVLVSLVFVVVALVGRTRRHPRAVLGAELLLAGLVVLSPVVLFVPVDDVWPWILELVGGGVQTLASAWLGIVLIQIVRQARGDVVVAPPGGADDSRSWVR